jgi:hypothetical protein
MTHTERHSIEAAVESSNERREHKLVPLYPKCFFADGGEAFISKQFGTVIDMLVAEAGLDFKRGAEATAGAVQGMATFCRSLHFDPTTRLIEIISDPVSVVRRNTTELLS